MKDYSFFNYMKQNDKKFLQKIIAVMMIILLFLIIIFQLENYRQKQISECVKILTQKQEISKIEKEYELNKLAFEKGVLKKPLAKEKVGIYQANLIKKLESKNLEVQNVTALSGSTKDSNYQEYEMMLTGSWQDTMNALTDIDKEPIAINFKVIRIEALSVDNSIKTYIKYKFYIFEE